LNSTNTNEHPYDWAVSGTPLGVWQTHDGSFSNMMSSVLTIRSDGTGSLKDQSALRGEESWDLVWRHLSPGHLQVVQFWEDKDKQNFSEYLWEDIHYAAEWCSGDTQDRIPVLKDTRAEAFWNLLSPIKLVARADHPG